MKLSDLIAQIGDDNITLQHLDSALISARDCAKDTSITFVSREASADNLVNQKGKTALIVWINRDDMERALTK